ncbi:hypothetical protein BVY03_03915 [bacterium K02(2017)]|nr:hypothetical protein BVY03_03915 [bacterium K02(2017)]
MSKYILLLLLLFPSVSAKAQIFQRPQKFLQEAHMISIAMVSDIKVKSYRCKKNVTVSLIPRESLKNRLPNQTPLKFKYRIPINAPECRSVKYYEPPRALNLRKGEDIIATIKYFKKNKAYLVTATLDIDKRYTIERFINRRF